MDEDEGLAQEAVVRQRGDMQNGYSVAEATQGSALAVARLYDLKDRKDVVEKPADPPAKRMQEAKTQPNGEGTSAWTSTALPRTS